MKCLLVSDLHYALKQYDWVAEVAADFDVVVIAGDHLDISGHVAGPAQIVVILKHLQRLMARTRLLVCSGNHDLDSRDEAGEKVARWMSRVRDLGIPTDGESVAVGDALFTICPWWDGPRARRAVVEQIARDAVRPKKTWIWLYHAPPDRSPTSWTGQRWYGDADLVALIGAHAPDIVLAGHIHQAPFAKDGSWVDRIGNTWVFNSGQQPGPAPAHVMINTELGEALWFSLAGSQVLRLDAPLQRPLAKLGALPDWVTSPRRDPGRSPA
jgi:Icc-related predicted phosphoesterase